VTARIAVFIMAKAPRVGEVKTRLCPPLAPAEATELYRAFLLDKIEQVRGLRSAIPAIAYTPPEERAVFETLAPGVVLFPQEGEDLGARLANSFDALLRSGYTGALAVDSDTPTLPPEYLEHALAAVAEPDVDLVLGPSEDGGYYLIGLRRPCRDLFEAMAWSTPAVLPETIRRARAKGLRIALLPSWFDVDTAEEMERLRRDLETADGSAPRHTRSFLKARAEDARLSETPWTTLTTRSWNYLGLDQSSPISMWSSTGGFSSCSAQPVTP